MTKKEVASEVNGMGGDGGLGRVSGVWQQKERQDLELREGITQ